MTQQQLSKTERIIHTLGEEIVAGKYVPGNPPHRGISVPVVEGRMACRTGITSFSDQPRASGVVKR
ncbi:hypothetical protein CRX72_00645 [Pantoea sp. BRM17]|nr:hypothetical protein CRX72_00645 [Pantoea sp. BRM17]